MPRSEQRRAALEFCLTIVALVGCLFGLICILTFDAADPPSTAVWPQADPPHNACGIVGAWIAYYAFYYIGVGVYPLAVLLTAAVIAKLRHVELSDPWLRFVGLWLIVAAISTGAALFVDASNRYLLSGPGGVLGIAAAAFLQPQLQTTGTMIVLICAGLVGLILAADETVIRFTRMIGWAAPRSARVIARGSTVIGGAAASGYERLSASLAAIGPNAATAVAGPSSRARKPRQLALDLVDEDETPDVEEPQDESSDLESQPPSDEADEIAADDDSPVPSESVAPPSSDLATTADPVVTQLEADQEKPRRSPPRATPKSAAGDDDYQIASVDLLEEAMPIDKKAVEIRCREKAFILEQTLNEFRLEVRVVAIETGPVITVFELKLSPGIKVSQIVSLSNDMARALKAPAVRVVAPLPGKNTIGIEVPNLDKEKVRLRDLMEMTASTQHRYNLPLYLGKDAAGQPIITDLTRMPHLLIAGTTGSGKSVCISSIVMSFLMTKRPSEVNLILIDPKVVELSTFKSIPHLISPIVTEVGKAEAILDWAATKMDERYAILAEAGVKDISGYNKLGVEKLKERFEPANDEEMAKIPTHIPYIVIVIDELADLMMTSAKEVEFYLCRLAQKSRAVGIHLIVSTQRPQANVVTGLIKSNLPCRIAFRVSSRLDSRIVLDQNGGEVLLGQGDMLFLPPGTSKLSRAQGTFIGDNELRAVVRHCAQQAEPQFNSELIRLPSADAASTTAERDELFDQAVDIVIESGRGSVSLLQRRLTIGYGRASRLVDQMYAGGIVGEYKGSQAREVVITKEDWQSVRAARNSEERPGGLFDDG